MYNRQMVLNSPRNLMKNYNIKPSKGLGQNFLIDKGVLAKITEAAEINPKDTIIEIGPGLGVLTKALAQKARKVIAIEKDQKMVDTLKETLKDYKNIEIIKGDALKADIPISGKYKVVANLPYYITSPIIRRFLETKNQPSLMVLMVQKEVGQRICSKPPEMNLLAVSVQIYGRPNIIDYVSNKSFWPAPKVDSAVIKISDIVKPKGIDIYRFFKIVKAGFSQPRKQIVKNLSEVLKLDKEKAVALLSKNNIDFRRRSETLTIEEWKLLTKAFK